MRRPKQSSFCAYTTTKEKSAARKVATGIVIAIIVLAGIILLAPALANFVIQQKDNPAITILQLQSYSLGLCLAKSLCSMLTDRINKDRTDFGLLPVKLSSNQAERYMQRMFSEPDRYPTGLQMGKSPT